MSSGEGAAQQDPPQNEQQNTQQSIQPNAPQRSLEDRIVDKISVNLQNTIKEEVRRAMESSKSELAELSAEACNGSMEELTATAAKKARQMEPQLKKVGNQKQYKYNQELLDEIEMADRYLDKGNIERAKEKLSNGKKLINKKFKQIKLADREEHGWQVVKFYESDDLASDSEDEKSINRAKREAAAAAKKRETKRKERKRTETSSFRSRSNKDYSATASFKGRTPLFCYGCNREGHTKKFCFASMDKTKK